MNKYLAIARLTRDPEMRALQSGSNVAQFGIAISDRKKDTTGEWIDDPIFWDCEAWNGTAEFIVNHLQKGDPVVLEGRIKLETWTDKATEQKRSKHKFVVERASFVPKTKDRGPQGGDDDQGGHDEVAPSPAPPQAAPAKNSFSKPANQGRRQQQQQQTPIDTDSIPF